MGFRKDITGERFGKLVAVGYAETHVVGKKTVQTIWECKCDCGNTCYVSQGNLNRGVTKSCGCIRSKSDGDASRIKKTRLYAIWSGIRSRTGVKRGANEHTKRIYSNRGISMCDEWRNSYKAFKEWSVNNGYEDNLEIDRIDTNLGYTPDNCRWVTSCDNSNNRRNTLRLPDGTPLAEFCRECDVPMRDNGFESSTYASIAWCLKHGKISKKLIMYAEMSGKLDELYKKCNTLL